MFPKGMDALEAREQFAAINAKHRAKYVEEARALGKGKAPSWSVIEAVRQEWAKACGAPYKPLPGKQQIQTPVSGKPIKTLKDDPKRGHESDG